MDSARASACHGSSNWSSSGWVKVALPEVEIDLVGRRGGGAPDLVRRKHDGVAMLRTCAVATGARIRENVSTVPAMNQAALAAGVAGQPRVAVRIHVSRGHGLAGREAGRVIDRSHE